ncbi:hypothetical protein GCM10009347_41620 [Shewanella algicola]|uniref:Uncharacterized protein n=1 Tax=Shewanella algicola TaxID=640633 RepID=A0A9X1Z8C6_9GAMM|nr:hypothetical protein [Shewanella algicola]MCL1107760.1 hypothetical protein [Shewanella algicola]GGP72612.1 hypothetical protein GCM10009347_41620 [Shewanella algicola]
MSALYNKGQALVEGVIALTFVIVPLLILLPYMSKMTEVQHRVSEAAQYTSWERTVWKDSRPSLLPNNRSHHSAIMHENDIAIDIPWRFYQKNGVLINSQNQTEWDWSENIHPLLKSQTAKNSSNKVLLSLTDENVTDGELSRFERKERSGKTPGSIGSTIDSMVGLLSFTGFNLDKSPYYQTEVSTKLQNHYLEPFDQLNLSFKGNSALMASGWNASGGEHAEKRVKKLVLTSVLDNGLVRLVQRIGGFIPFGKELKTNSLKFGHVDSDVLPENRLCRYGSENCGG